MSSMLPDNPQTSSGLGGAAPTINAPTTDDPNFYVDPVQGEYVPQNYGLPNSPLMPSPSALGGYTDSQYLSDDAALRQQIGQQYAQILQQLGYMDPNSGNVIPGSVIQDANIQLAQEQQAAQNALMGVVQNAQQNGTLFSGIRGTQTAQALYPHTQNMAAIHLNTQRSLQDLYNQAQNLVAGYNTTNQQNLAAAAQRQLALTQAGQTAPVGGGTSAPPASSSGDGVIAGPLYSGSFNMPSFSDNPPGGVINGPLYGGTLTNMSNQQGGGAYSGVLHMPTPAAPSSAQLGNMSGRAL